MTTKRVSKPDKRIRGQIKAFVTCHEICRVYCVAPEDRIDNWGNIDMTDPAGCGC